jgi:hypothetical protein
MCDSVAAAGVTTGLPLLVHLPHAAPAPAACHVLQCLLAQPALSPEDTTGTTTTTSSSSSSSSSRVSAVSYHA